MSKLFTVTEMITAMVPGVLGEEVVGTGQPSGGRGQASLRARGTRVKS